MPIVGTAGHVDHGKSSLVRALTGTDPDRWLEEQRRGMTLDLGFARLTFDDGIEAGVIDVPGHERFLHNMLAGAAGMEIVLLVIAANEGVMPQTLEHLAILRFLNVRRTLIVLTKADAVDAADLGPIETRLRADLRGTIADGAPLYAVSTLTGAGVADLRRGIHAALAALPARAADAPVYFPIDRVFALAGHGTIVTGTLMQGRIAVGDTLALAPAGRDVRVRSIQVFGRSCATATGGTRVALNVPGIERSDVTRGAILAGGQFERATRLAVRFEPLPGALSMLRRRTPVRAYIGAAEILATLVFARLPEGVEPVDAQLLLRTATVMLPGAPFVLRRLSPMDVIGGGTLAAASAADAGATERSATDDVETRRLDLVHAVIAATTVSGATVGAVSAATNLDEPLVGALLTRLVAGGRAVVLAKPQAYAARDVTDAVLARVIERLEARQRERPWLTGVTSLALAQAVNVAEAALIRVLAVAVESGELVYRGGYYATPDFTPRLAPEQQAFFDRIFAAAGDGRGGADAPVALEDLRGLMRASKIPEVALAFETLLATGMLARVGESVYRGAHLRAIRSQLETALQNGGRITVAQFRDLTGTSRKYAVPLLEFFDASGVTIRTGDLRVLRQTPAARRP